MADIPFFSYLLMLSFLISISLSAYGAYHRHIAIGRTFSLLSLAVAAWSLFQAFEMLATSMEYKIFWAKLEYFGIASIPLLWFLLSVSYSKRFRRPVRRFIIMLWVIPLCTIIIALSNDWHRLLWSGFDEMEQSMPLVSRGRHLVYLHGPWFWVTFSYSYCLLFLGSLLLVREAVRSRRLYRFQAIVVALGALMPWIGNFLYITNLTPVPGLDITPAAFTLSGIMVAFGIFKYRFLSVAPIVREMIIEQMDNGVLVLDHESAVMYCNMKAEKILNAGRDIRTGTPLDQLEPLQEIIKLCGASPDRSCVSKLREEDSRFYEITVSDLRDGRGRFLGKVLFLHDTTERKKDEETLKKLSLAVSHSPASVVVTDRGGLIEYVNPKFTQLTGYTMEEATGINPRILKSGETPPESYKQLWDTIMSGDTWYGEFINKKKNGERYIEYASISPIYGDGGHITHFVAVKEDITVRKAMEKALREKNELLGKELAYARTIVDSMIPVSIPQYPDLDIGFRYLPMFEIGGDYFSITELEGGGLGVFIGDISGHGVAAALFISLLKLLTDQTALLYGHEPGRYLEVLNSRLRGVLSGFFITAAYCLVEKDEQGYEVTFASGGHPPLLLHRGDTGTIEQVTSRGKMLAWIPDLKYDQVRLRLRKGDSVYLYSDGIYEVRNRANEMLDIEGFSAIVRKNAGRDVFASIESIINEIERFQGGSDTEDDVILIGIRAT